MRQDDSDDDISSGTSSSSSGDDASSSSSEDESSSMPVNRKLEGNKHESQKKTLKKTDPPGAVEVKDIDGDLSIGKELERKCEYRLYI